MIDARVLTLSDREPVIELPIPKSAGRSWAPNVTVGVLVLRGCLREAPWWSAFTWGWREPAEWWRAFRYEGRDWHVLLHQAVQRGLLVVSFVVDRGAIRLLGLPAEGLHARLSRL